MDSKANGNSHVISDFVFITGNQAKADYLKTWLGRPIEHQKVDLEEIQSLDPAKVLEDKARRAYAIVGKPVLVEDVSLVFTALGHLPGTLIKWFLEELGTEGLCDLAGRLEHPEAIASMTYALFDGEKLMTFSGEVTGRIAPQPRGEGFGWSAIFIPDGFEITNAEMSAEDFHKYSHRGKALRKLQAYLQDSALSS